MSGGAKVFGGRRRVAALAAIAIGGGAAAQMASAASQPVISVPSAAQVTEGSGAGCPSAPPQGVSCVVIAVAISEAQSRSASVRLSTIDDSARAPDDYGAISQIVTIPAGATRVDVPLQVRDDDVFEGDQTFKATLSGPAGGDVAGGPSLGTATTTVTIHDDEAPPVLSIGDVSAIEGTDAAAAFPVTLSRPTEVPFAVPAALHDGTATSGTDFQPPGPGANPIPVSAGPATPVGGLSVPVTILDDGTGEPTEQFTLELQAPQWPGAAPAGVSGLPSLDPDHHVGTATITDDDPARITIPATAEVTEGAGVPCPGDSAAGMTCLRLPVSISPAQANGASVRWATQDGTAKASGDYTAVASSLLTIPAGATSADVYVPVADDNVYEGDQTFSVRLSQPLGGDHGSPTLGTSTTTVTLHDNDAPPTISIGTGTIAGGSEGTGGSGRQLLFPVTLSRPTEVTVRGDFEIVPGTAQPKVGELKNPPDGTQDYIVPTSTTFTVPASPTSPSAASTNLPGISIVGDSVDETDETLSVKLQNVRLDNPVPVPSGGPGLAYGTQTASGTIVDDDGPTITAADTSVKEGAAGSATQATVLVQLSKPSPQDITVNYTTADGTAKAGQDYVGVTTGQTITIRAGVPVATIPITVDGDDVHEGDETFKVSLSGSVNAGVADGTATVTITDDDPPPAPSVPDVRAPEGTGSPSSAVVTVALAAPSATTLKVAYATADGTASAGSDYQSTSGTLTFDPGDTAEQVTVPLVPDGQLEADETFALRAVVTTTDGSGQTVADPSVPGATGTVTIADDDLTASSAAKLSVDGARTVEGDSGTRPARFTVRLDTPSPRPVTVRYATADGTAMAPADYLPVDGVVTFAPGDTAETVTVPVIGDRDQERNEDYRLVLADPVNASLASGTAIGVITDDDVGGGPIDVRDERIRLGSLLCSSTRPCPGLTVGWDVERAGTVSVRVTARIPGRRSGRAARRSATRTVTLARRDIRVRRAGRGSAHVRRSASAATARLLRELRARRVRTATVRTTFTNATGARQAPTTTTVALDDDDAGGGPLTLSPGRIDAGRLLCGGGCRGLTLAWHTQRKGRFSVRVSGERPASKRGSRKPIRLFSRRVRVRRASAGHARLRLSGARAGALRGRLRAAHVRRLRVDVTFTAPGREAQRLRFRVRLR